MKQTFLLTLLFVTVKLSAQITLVQSDYPSSMIGTDSLKQTTSATAFPLLAPENGGIWDMSIVTDTALTYYAYRVPTNIYQFADSSYYNFDGYFYQGNVQSSVISMGIFEYGINVLDTEFSLSSSIAGGISDSIFIPTQNIEYTSPICKIEFPSTYHSSWTSIYQYDFAYEISLEIYSLDHAPCIKRSYISEKDTIIGWGKMRVNDLTDSPSVYVNVLQIEAMIIITDSFLLNGSTSLINPILTDLGLSQGQTTTTYQQNYYRKGEITPLAQVSFMDAAFAHPYKAVTHAQRLTDAVPGLIKDDNVSLYPNPAKGTYISVDLPTATGKWNYELVNAAGQNISGGSLQLTGKQAQVSLPGSLARGIYYIRLMNDGRQVAVKQIDIRK